jgi:hypothetical protein
MVSFRHFSGKAVVAAAFAVGVLALFSQTASASSFNYVFTGTAEALYNGSSVGNTDFTLSFAEDTSALDNRGGGIYSYDNVGATLDTADGNFVLTGVTLQVNGNAGSQSVGFYNADATNGLGLSMVTPAGYDLTSNLDVPVLWSSLSITDLGGNFKTSDGNTLEITSVANLGFTAVGPPAPTPEPSSLLLLTSGLPGLALLRRRFLKA